MLSVDDLARIALSLRKEHEDARGSEGQGSSKSRFSSSSASRILERDRREPGSVPKPLGGLSACSQGDLDALLLLRESGWDPQNAVDKHGNTALMSPRSCTVSFSSCPAGGRAAPEPSMWQ
mmetsp:Transcript_29566/g.66893  ORF Transcript_29566/g.66893 Transcript_29566/m.66893 type:complete len:121 (-) Transcript_29566:176-538(-)